MSELMISGKWKVNEESKAIRGLPEKDKYGVTIHQDGQSIQMEIEDVETPVFGKLEGNTTHMDSYSYPEQDGMTKVSDFVLEFSNDGKSASHRDTWVWQSYYGRERPQKGISKGQWTWISSLSDEKPKKKLVIRKAGKEDLDKIKELFSSWGTQDWDKKSAEEYYDQYFTQNRYPDDEVFVGILGNEIVSVIGYCLEKEASGIYWLGWFYNHKLHTRQGYGGEMLDYVMKELKNKKARKLFAYTSTDEFYTGAQNLYLSRGFIKESVLKDFYEDGEDQIVFGLHLQKKATGEVFPVETLVVINWEKLTNWKDAYNKNDKSKDYGVYEILGWHTVFKDNALLYIGKASEQTFGKRISQETWLKDEWDLTIYLGRIQAINDRKQFSVSLKNNIISDVESLLIYFHSPPYNSVSISEQPKPRNDLRIINIGDSGALYTEISHKGLRLYK